MDLHSMCRSCMAKINPKHNLYLEQNFKEKYNVCTGIDLSSDCSMPQHFCSECIPKIESSYNFIKEARRIEDIFINLVSFKNPSSYEFQEQKVKAEVNKELFSNELKIEFDHSLENKTGQNPNEKQSENFELKLEEIDEKLNDHSTVIIEYNQCSNKMKVKKKLNKCDSMTTITTKHNVIKTVDSKQSAKTHICMTCNKKYLNELSLQNHIRRVHSAARKCPVCFQEFKLLSALKTHLAAHAKERPYSCDDCGKTFEGKIQVRNHLQQVHRPDGPYECNICHSRIKTKYNLDIHIKRHNTASRKYLCSVCGMNFDTKLVLREHSYRHTGEKPQQCALCGFRSRAAACLRQHVLRRHNLERRYRCDAPACGKAFATKACLQRHQRVHTGERPYKCSECAERFIDMWKRKMHLVKKHNIPVEEIPTLNSEGKPVENNYPRTYKGPKYI